MPVAHGIIREDRVTVLTEESAGRTALRVSRMGAGVVPIPIAVTLSRLSVAGWAPIIRMRWTNVRVRHGGIAGCEVGGERRP